MSSSPERSRRLSRRAWLCGTTLGMVRISYADQQPRRLPPPDDQKIDAGLNSLLEQMRSMVASRNAAALTALMLPTFRVEFDSGKGPLAFRRYWKMESRNSAVWDVLGKALAVQGTFYLPSLFCIPYFLRSFPRELDPLAYVVSVGAAATLRDRPARDGASVGTADHAIIQLAKPVSPPVIIPDNSFLAVNDPGFGSCYVAGSEVYSPAAHRMFFERRNGKWLWISLAAATLADPPIVNHPAAAK